MGWVLFEVLFQFFDFWLYVVLECSDSLFFGKDVGELLGFFCGVQIVLELLVVLCGVDVLIDFICFEGILQYLDVCVGLGVNMVIGIIGMDVVQKVRVVEIVKWIVVVMVFNMSVGVNLVFRLFDIVVWVLV